MEKITRGSDDRKSVAEVAMWLGQECDPERVKAYGLILRPLMPARF